MSAQRFSVGKRFQWQRAGLSAAEAFQITHVPAPGAIRLENLVTGAALETTLAELIQALFDGRLQFEWCGKGAPAGRPDGILATQPPYVDLSNVPSHLVAIAQRRLEILTPLLQLASQARTRQCVAEHVAQIKQRQPLEEGPSGLGEAISVTSVYRWMHDYVAAGHDLRALIPSTSARGGKGQMRVDPEVEAHLDSVIRDVLLRPESATLNDVRAELAVRIQAVNQTRSSAEHLAMPSLTTLQRRVESLDLLTRLQATEGTRAARRAFKQYGQVQAPAFPLERVEIDHTRLDVLIVDDEDGLPLGRPTLTHCLDYATRYPLGYYIGFEPPSWYAVMECLHHAICPKEDLPGRFGTQHGWLACGVPVTLRIDNGKEFIGRDLKDACVLLGMLLECAPVQTPEFKAGVERLFGTLNTGFIHSIPGTTFASADQRGDYDAARQACVTLSDFERMFNGFIVDIYAQRFHRGLNGIPARSWERAMQSGFSPRVPPSREELLILLGRTETRIIQHYGIELAGLRYNCAELAPLRHRLDGAPAKVKYHPGDLSRIHVYDPASQRYLVVPALDAEYTQGLSLWKHQVIKAYARAEWACVDWVALGEAKRKIKQIIADARQNTRAARRTGLESRRQQARFESGGAPPSQRDQPGPLPPSASAAPAPQPVCLPATKRADDADAWEIILGMAGARSLEANP